MGKCECCVSHGYDHVGQLSRVDLKLIKKRIPRDRTVKERKGKVKIAAFSFPVLSISSRRLSLFVNSCTVFVCT